jgi:hypothetical protein
LQLQPAPDDGKDHGKPNFDHGLMAVKENSSSNKTPVFDAHGKTISLTFRSLPAGRQIRPPQIRGVFGVS